jgi:DNA-directed RNA polymerase subunit RPC12/RpoP
MTIKRRKVDAWEWSCVCERCSHSWQTIAADPPERCPGCKARNWNKPARKKVRTFFLYRAKGLQRVAPPGGERGFATAADAAAAGENLTVALKVIDDRGAIIGHKDQDSKRWHWQPVREV